MSTTPPEVRAKAPLPVPTISKVTGWDLLTVGGLVLYLCLGLAYLVLGQPNADEGWYLYAGRLALRGELPYRDFAYTQMPLLPYVYGVPQALFGESVYLGRATSLLFSTGAAGLGALMARRYAGPPAGAAAAVVAGAFTYGIYHGTIVKTYALVSFLFVLTLYTLSLRLRDEIKYPLATAFALAATLVRLSAAAFAAPVAAYALFLGGTGARTRAGVALVCALAAGLAGAFLLADPHAASWNLVTHHTGQWGGASLVWRLRTVVEGRIPASSSFFGPVLLLALAAGYVGVRDRGVRSFLASHGSLAAGAAGVLLFAAVHLATGTFYQEYLVPAVVALIPVLVTVLGRLHAEASAGAGRLVEGLLGALVAVLLLSHGTDHLDRTGGRLPLQEVRDVAAVVAAGTEPSDEVLALEALWVVLEADRRAAPGVTMSLFSYQDLDSDEALRLSVVNYDLLVAYVQSGAAGAIVLTDHDWEVLSRRGVYAREPQDPVELRRALAERYELALTYPRFGQWAGNAYVYLRRGR
ncbi:MAG TPA: hypothetical protein VIO14_05895 [Dehalococcoidia bacterium]